MDAVNLNTSICILQLDANGAIKISNTLLPSLNSLADLIPKNCWSKLCHVHCGKTGYIKIFNNLYFKNVYIYTHSSFHILFLIAFS